MRKEVLVSRSCHSVICIADVLVVDPLSGLSVRALPPIFLCDPMDSNLAGETLTHLEWLEDVVLPEDGNAEAAADLRLLAVLSSRGMFDSLIPSTMTDLLHSSKWIADIIAAGIMGSIERTVSTFRRFQQSRRKETRGDCWREGLGTSLSTALSPFTLTIGCIDHAPRIVEAGRFWKRHRHFSSLWARFRYVLRYCIKGIG